MTQITDESFARQFDRLPPHSVESEMCMLASMILDRDARREIINCVHREDFFQADHQIIFDLIERRHRADEPVDWMLLRGDLESRQLLDEVGGMPYLAQISDSAPSAAHGIHYAQKVVKTARLRSLISSANDALRDCYSPGAEDGWEALCRKIGDDAYSLLNHGTRETIRLWRDIVEEALERKNDGKRKRVSTGIHSLDEVIGGLPKGRMSIVGGRPGSGKSQLGKQFAKNIASAGTRVGIIAVEEDRFKIVDNLLSNESGVENRRIVYEMCDQIEWGEIYAAVSRMNDYPLYVDDERTDLSGVEATVSRMVTKFGCEVVVIDYLQLIDPGEGEAAQNRDNQIRTMSNALKRTFKRLGVAGVVLAQLNRASGSDRPQMSNLRESGSIENDGDLIMLLHREDYYRCNSPDFVPDNILEINVAKNKDGPTAVVPTLFDGRHQSITDIAHGIPE